MIITSSSGTVFARTRDWRAELASMASAFLVNRKQIPFASRRNSRTEGELPSRAEGTSPHAANTPLTVIKIRADQTKRTVINIT